MIKSAQRLYQRQDKVIKTLRSGDALDAPYLLAGGTALARGYLHHRVSYDLDFFVDGKFSPELLQGRLRRLGLVMSDVAVQAGDHLAHELHGTIDGAPPVKLSFIEDPFATMFKVVEVEGFLTEVIEGLYHRKVRTLSGSYNIDGRTVGARQTARDVFDLYVLDRTVRPIIEFVTEVNAHGAGVPEDGLIAGFRSMPWNELMDEFELLVVADEYKDVSLSSIKRHFDKSLGLRLSKP